MIFLVNLVRICREKNIKVIQETLPEGAQKLLRLAFAVPERQGTRRTILGQPVLAKIGNITIEAHRNWNDLLRFVGETGLAMGSFLRGRARFRGSDLFYQLEAAGPSALFIVTLISTLVGMILAFVGAVQLRLFGAEIFIANLVGLGMAREMGAMMTAIIMAGRTGAAFAAQLGTMQVNEEIDAFKTMAISPVEFLVLPRLVALCITMPPALYLCGFHGHPWRGDCQRDHARHLFLSVFPANPRVCSPQAFSHRNYQIRDFRGSGCHRRLFSRAAVRPECFGRRLCRNQCRGHFHRVDHCRRCADYGYLPGHRSLKWRGPNSCRCAT